MSARHRVTGDVTQSSRRPGYHALHVAIDDNSRVGFSLILPDETSRSAITFVVAALRYYKAMGVRITGIMAANGSAYRSKKFAKLLRHLMIKRVRTRPLHTTHQWQGRTFHPGAVAGMGVCLHLPEFGCQNG